MQAIHKALRVIHEREPRGVAVLRQIACANVFDQKHAAVPNMFDTALDGYDLVLVSVAAVVNDDIYVTYFGKEMLPEFGAD